MNQRISLLASVGVALSLTSMSCGLEPEEEKIPFGYDRDFDYLSVLKSSPEYAFEPTQGYPNLTYQDPANDSLIELRTAYDLDTVAGAGDDLSKIFNLLRWAHQSLRHDGARVGPEQENSLSILQYHDEAGNGVNCVMMAIVLNEAYLAMGLKSRVIHGNARDWVFNGEWHAFNAVYSYTLNKWVFIDPTNQAYFTDDNGTPLSVAEIRDFLRRDIPLHLNDDADYNGSPLDAGDYVHYLSKNLYRFSSTVHSAFGNYWMFHLPEGADRAYFHLDPANEAQQGLGVATNYFTSNPDYFWKQP